VDQCVELGSEASCNVEGERALYDLSGEGVCESDDFHQDSCRAKGDEFHCTTDEICLPYKLCPLEMKKILELQILGFTQTNKYMKEIERLKLREGLKLSLKLQTLFEL